MVNNQAGGARAYGGCLIGDYHKRNGLSNQDDFKLMVRDDCTVAIVCDGMGSSPSSHVGSHLLSDYLLYYMVESLREGKVGELFDQKSRSSFLVDLYIHILDYMLQIANSTRPDRVSAIDFIREYMMTTFIVSVTYQDEMIVFYRGDGYFVDLMNGEGAGREGGDLLDVQSLDSDTHPHGDGVDFIASDIHWGTMREINVLCSGRARSHMIATDGLRYLTNDQILDLVPDVDMPDDFLQLEMQYMKQYSPDSLDNEDDLALVAVVLPRVDCEDPKK